MPCECGRYEKRGRIARRIFKQLIHRNSCQGRADVVRCGVGADKQARRSQRRCGGGRDRGGCDWRGDARSPELVGALGLSCVSQRSLELDIGKMQIMGIFTARRKSRGTVSSSSPPPGTSVPKDTGTPISVHSSTIHKSRDMEASYVSIDRGMDEDVACVGGCVDT